MRVTAATNNALVLFAHGLVFVFAVAVFGASALLCIGATHGLGGIFAVAVFGASTAVGLVFVFVGYTDGSLFAVAHVVVDTGASPISTCRPLGIFAVSVGFARRTNPLTTKGRRFRAVPAATHPALSLALEALKLSVAHVAHDAGLLDHTILAIFLFVRAFATLGEVFCCQPLAHTLELAT